MSRNSILRFASSASRSLGRIAIVSNAAGTLAVLVLVIVMNVDAYDGWTTEGHTWWEVGTPSVSPSEKVLAAHAEAESARVRQRKGV